MRARRFNCMLNASAVFALLVAANVTAATVAVVEYYNATLDQNFSSSLIAGLVPVYRVWDNRADTIHRSNPAYQAWSAFVAAPGKKFSLTRASR